MMKTFLFSLLALVVLAGCSQNTASNQFSVTNLPAKSSIDEEFGIAFAGANAAQLLFKEDQSVAYFEGVGNEYATFTETTEWLSNEYVRLTIDNGGSIITRYFYVSTNAVHLVKEVVDELSPIPLQQVEALGKGTPIFETPLALGATYNNWQVTSTTASVSTPYKDFTNVTVLEIDTPNEVNKIYIAQGYGMIKKEFIVTIDNEQQSIISTLKEINYQ